MVEMFYHHMRKGEKDVIVVEKAAELFAAESF